MTVRVWRWLMLAAVIAPCIGIAGGAEPPASERKASADDPSAERARLQAELLQLLRRIPPPTSAPSTYTPMPTPSGPKTKYDPGTSSKSIDPIREGTNYFRDNDFEGARRTFQLIDPTTLGREDRAFVRYMLACSLRRQNRIADAEPIYREVANSADDEFLASCAIWQLSLIKSDQELQAQLEQLRSRAKSK